MTNISKYLIIVGGPTASGKTAMAIRLANHYQTEILSADSRQFYREMNIGTAKQTTAELAAAKHHFVSSISIEDHYSVGQYEREAIILLDKLFEKKDVVILTGGSGLFINAVCKGLDAFPEIKEENRKMAIQIYEKEGVEGLQEILKINDFDYYQKVDLQNKQRLMRAVEVILETGKPYSSFLAKNKVTRNFIPIYLQVHHPRKKLYDRINYRVKLMIESGLVEEVKGLFSCRSNNALQTVGYQEIFEHLDGNISLERAVELIQQNSRRYAKRQITWMRRDGFWKHIRPSDFELAVDYIEAFMNDGIGIKQYSNSDSAPPKYTWGDRTYLMLGLMKNMDVIDVAKFEKKGKKVTVNSDLNSTNSLLLHEVSLLLEELNTL